MHRDKPSTIAIGMKNFAWRLTAKLGLIQFDSNSFHVLLALDLNLAQNTESIAAAIGAKLTLLTL